MLMHRMPAVTVLAACAAPAFAQLGSLAPPAGPVIDTGPNLREIEPRTIVNETNTPSGGNFDFIISTPGHYVFDGNKSVEAGRDGILITASDVVLDMNGFSLTTPLAIIFASGITISPESESNVTVRNGTLRNFGDGGVILPANSLVENVKVFNGFSSGITAGDNSTVRNCLVSGNTGPDTIHGILVGDDSRVESCTVKTTQGSGITCGEQGQILGNTVVDTQAAGINVGDSSRVVGNLVENIGTSGVIAGAACFISDNTVRNTLAFGIRADMRARVVGNHVVDIGTSSIGVDQGSTVSGNTISEVAMFGIVIFASDCTADGNSISFCDSGAFNIGADLSRITRNDVSASGGTAGAPGDPGFYIQGNPAILTRSFIGPTNDLMSPWTNVVD